MGKRRKGKPAKQAAPARNVHLCSCGQPAPGTTVCRSCEDKLRGELRALVIRRHRHRRVTSLLDDLTITLTRQVRFDVRADGSRSTTMPLMFHLEASEVGWDLRNTLTSWARVMLDALPPPPPIPPGPICRRLCAHGSCAAIRWALAQQPPADTLEAVARWLHHRVYELVRHRDADQAVAEITNVVTRVRAVIDRPPELVYVGICAVDGCTAEVFARPDKPVAICRRCRSAHDVKERRAEMARTIWDQKVTATSAVMYLRALDIQLSASAIRGYAHRGRLVAVDHTVRGAVYRLGDILAIVQPDMEQAS